MSEGYSLCGQNFEQCTWFISLEEEMVRHATIINMWAPANNVTGLCGFGNSMAGESGLSWSGRGVWKDLKGRKPGELLSTHQKLTTAKGDLGHQVDSMPHSVGASQPLPAVTNYQSRGSGTEGPQFVHRPGHVFLHSHDSSFRNPQVESSEDGITQHQQNVCFQSPSPYTLMAQRSW